MTPPDLGNILNKVKSATKQAADQTSRLAKIAKLKTNVLTLNAEKDRHLKTIGIRAYILFKDEKSKDGAELMDRVKDELAQIERIETKISELNVEIADLQAGNAHVDVTDVTEK
jgi:hypothetical protein